MWSVSIICMTKKLISNWTKFVWRIEAWYAHTKEVFPFWVARQLPKPVVMWCFIWVHSLSGNGPGKEYSDAYDLAKKKWKLKSF